MTQEQTVVKKRRRVPKPGTWFAFLRVIGIILEVIGVFIIAASAIGLIVILVKIGPDLVAMLALPEISQTGGFYLIMIIMWVSVPLVTGLAGILMAGVGFVFYRLATIRPAIEPVV